jgi:hypothetical protein
MTTLIPDLERNFLADAEAARIGALSIHTATTGLTGAAEAAGGAPAYARLVPTFTPAGVEGVLGATAQPATVGVAWSDEVYFDAPAGTYTHCGAWSDLVGGTFRLGNVLVSSELLVAQGTITHSIGVGPLSGA